MGEIIFALLLAYVIALSAIERWFLCRLIKADKIKDVDVHPPSKPAKFRSAHQNAIDNQYGKDES